MTPVRSPRSTGIFLDRHRQSFAKNRRMSFQLKNLERKSDDELVAIRTQARQLKEAISSGERI